MFTMFFLFQQDRHDGCEGEECLENGGTQSSYAAIAPLSAKANG